MPAIVDAHAQVFLPVSEDYPRAADELVPADADAPIERLHAAMTANDVSAAVLVPADSHDRYVAEILASDPDRYAAVAVAAASVLGRTERDPVEAFRARRSLFPFHALRTSWLGDAQRPVKESPFFPVLEELRELGLPLWTYLPPDQLVLLEELVTALPDLTIVLSHLGLSPLDVSVDAHGRPRFPDPFPAATLDTLRRLAEAETVNVVLSGQYAVSKQQPPYHDLDEIVGSLVSWYGVGRMLWGSGFPWTEDEPGYGPTADLPRAMLPQLTESELAQVRGGTALRLFPHLRT